jgi:hypothetical protein
VIVHVARHPEYILRRILLRGAMRMFRASVGSGADPHYNPAAGSGSSVCGASCGCVGWLCPGAAAGSRVRGTWRGTALHLCEHLRVTNTMVNHSGWYEKSRKKKKVHAAQCKTKNTRVPTATRARPGPWSVEGGGWCVVRGRGTWCGAGGPGPLDAAPPKPAFEFASTVS